MQTYRIFSLVLYYENLENVLNNVKKNDLTYFYIKHKAEEEDKKNHFHFLIYTKNVTTILKISKLIDLAPNYIKVKSSNGERYTLKNSIKYLLHYKMKNKKYQYTIDEIITNEKDLLFKHYNLLVGTIDNTKSIKDIYSYIIDNKIDTIRELTKYCIDNDYLDILKKYQYIFINLILEIRKRY